MLINGVPPLTTRPRPAAADTRPEYPRAERVEGALRADASVERVVQGELVDHDVRDPYGELFTRARAHASTPVSPDNGAPSALAHRALAAYASHDIRAMAGAGDPSGRFDAYA